MLGFFGIDFAPSMPINLGDHGTVVKGIIPKNIDGTTRIDFLNSLCIQVIPPFIRDRVLLEGAIRTFRPREYAAISADQKLISWRDRVWRQFKSSVCEPAAEVVQSLSDGREKILRGVAISWGAIEWYRSGGKLKQFYGGPVEFVPKIGPKIE